jgi:hypothetical protein
MGPAVVVKISCRVVLATVVRGITSRKYPILPGVEVAHGLIAVSIRDIELSARHGFTVIPRPSIK